MEPFRSSVSLQYDNFNAVGSERLPTIRGASFADASELLLLQAVQGAGSSPQQRPPSTQPAATPAEGLAAIAQAGSRDEEERAEAHRCDDAEPHRACVV